MTDTCKSCRNTKPGQLTRQGFQACKLDVSYTFYPSRHSCDKYQAKPQAVQATKPSACDIFIANRASQATRQGEGA